MSMPVTWPRGRSCAKEMEIVPEPEPTSRSFREGLEDLRELRVGRRWAALV